MKNLVALTTLFLLATLCGCGKERSWDAAEKYVRSTVSKSSQMKLVGLQMTDAQPGVDNRRKC